MEFWEHPTIYQAMKKVHPSIGSPEEYYNDAIRYAFEVGRDSCTINQLEMERAWGAAKKPYYLVFPAIIPMLTRLNLDIDSGLVKPPLDTLCIRLPSKSNSLKFEFNRETYYVRTILMSVARIKDYDGLTLWINIGESSTIQGLSIPICTYRNFRCKPGQTIEEDIKNLPMDTNAELGVVMPREVDYACVRLACSLCLMAQDPEIINPDVLNKDQEKFNKSGDEKFIEKAHRRGKVGWTVGAKLEVIPHVRRPHPAIVWTGKGRTTPKIVFRKGSIVHRKTIEKLPTGFSPQNE